MLASFGSAILIGWPYPALVGGVGGLFALVLWPRPGQRTPRFYDPTWLVCLMLPLYMVHQFEEHGINLLGQRYQFIHELCATLGHPDLAGCPASPGFIFAVNVGGVWIAGLTAILYRHRNVLVGACALGIPLVNAFAHLRQAVVLGAYNSGLLTAIVLFLPFCVWTLRVLWRTRELRAAGMAAVIGTGVVLHAVLLGSLLAFAAGWLPLWALLLINVLDGFLPLWVASHLPRRSV